MAKILFGFGGCVFDDGVSVATFTGGIGTIEYIPHQRRERLVNGGFINKLKGYDVKITCNELYNLDSDDWEEYQKLVYILNGIVGTDRTITVTPRNDSGIDSNVSFSCYLDSSFKPDDLHRTKIGQKLSLSFTCSTLQSTIFNIFSDTTAGVYWDSTDQYYDGTDTYYNGLG